MNITKEFFEEDIKYNLFPLAGILYAVVSHGKSGVTSQELATVNNDGTIINYFLN